VASPDVVGHPSRSETKGHCQVLGDGADLGFQLVGELGQADGTLAHVDEGLIAVRVRRSAAGGQISWAQLRALHSSGMARNWSRRSAGTVTRTEANASSR
jgi:hypothetical protein